MAGIDITVKVNGGLFNKNIPESVRTALKQEAMDKLVARMERGGKGLGSKRNTISERPDGDLAVRVSSTRIWPRTKGTAWQNKNIAIAKSLLPRALKKYAERVVSEMGS